MDYAYQTTRALPCFNPDGTYYYYQRHAYSVGNSQKNSRLYNYNILNEIDNSSSLYNGNTISVNGDLNYRLGKIADFTAAASYSRSSTAQSSWFGESTNYVPSSKTARHQKSRWRRDGTLRTALWRRVQHEQHDL